MKSINDLPAELVEICLSLVPSRPKTLLPRKGSKRVNALRVDEFWKLRFVCQKFRAIVDHRTEFTLFVKDTSASACSGTMFALCCGTGGADAGISSEAVDTIPFKPNGLKLEELRSSLLMRSIVSVELIWESQSLPLRSRLESLNRLLSSATISSPPVSPQSSVLPPTPPTMLNWFRRDSSASVASASSVSCGGVSRIAVNCSLSIPKEAVLLKCVQGLDNFTLTPNFINAPTPNFSSGSAPCKSFCQTFDSIVPCALKLQSNLSIRTSSLPKLDAVLTFFLARNRFLWNAELCFNMLSRVLQTMPADWKLESLQKLTTAYSFHDGFRNGCFSSLSDCLPRLPNLVDLELSNVSKPVDFTPLKLLTVLKQLKLYGSCQVEDSDSGWAVVTQSEFSVESESIKMLILGFDTWREPTESESAQLANAWNIFCMATAVERFRFAVFKRELCIAMTDVVKAGRFRKLEWLELAAFESSFPVEMDQLLLALRDHCPNLTELNLKFGSMPKQRNFCKPRGADGFDMLEHMPERVLTSVWDGMLTVYTVEAGDKFEPWLKGLIITLLPLSVRQMNIISWTDHSYVGWKTVCHTCRSASRGSGPSRTLSLGIIGGGQIAPVHSHYLEKRRLKKAIRFVENIDRELSFATNVWVSDLCGSSPLRFAVLISRSDNDTCLLSVELKRRR